MIPLIINTFSVLFLIANIFMFVRNKSRPLSLRDVEQEPQLLLGECNHKYVLYKELEISSGSKGIVGFTHIHRCTKCGELIERKIKV